MPFVGVDDPADYRMADDVRLSEVLECNAFHILQRVFRLAETGPDAGLEIDSQIDLLVDYRDSGIGNKIGDYGKLKNKQGDGHDHQNSYRQNLIAMDVLKGSLDSSRKKEVHGFGFNVSILAAE